MTQQPLPQATATLYNSFYSFLPRSFLTVFIILPLTHVWLCSFSRDDFGERIFHSAGILSCWEATDIFYEYIHESSSTTIFGNKLLIKSYLKPLNKVILANHIVEILLKAKILHICTQYFPQDQIDYTTVLLNLIKQLNTLIQLVLSSFSFFF